MARERTKPDEEMGLQRTCLHAPPPALIPWNQVQTCPTMHHIERQALWKKKKKKKTILFHAFQCSKQSEGLSHLGL